MHRRWCTKDGRQLRDYVSIKDVVRANLLPLDRTGMAYRAFNVAAIVQ
jgi:nucleoside-diphosphate-sugar epimerase